MDVEKRRYLAQKRRDLLDSLMIDKKQLILASFISGLKQYGIEDVKVIQVQFPKSTILHDTWKYEPIVPISKKFNYRKGDNPTDVKNYVREWLERNSKQSVLINVNQLIKKGDWLEIFVSDLLLNFDLLFHKFDIEHSILVDKSDGTFLSICEFEDEVNIYKGLVSFESQIEYYGQLDQS